MNVSTKHHSPVIEMSKDEALFLISQLSIMILKDAKTVTESFRGTLENETPCSIIFLVENERKPS